MASFPHLSILTVCGLLLAGCMSEQSTKVVDSLKECPFLFPNNSSVNCAADVETISSTAAPSGWSCVDQIKGSTAEWVQLWTDGSGHFGIRGHSDSKGDRVTRILMQFKGTDQQSAHTYHHGEDYFAEFRAALGKTAAFDWWVETWNFTGGLSLAPNVELPVRAHVSEYEGDLWFVYAFQGQNAIYYKQAMALWVYGPLREWVPTHLIDAGADFQLAVRVGNPMSAHGEYIPDEPSPLPDVPWPDPLPGKPASRCTM